MIRRESLNGILPGIFVPASLLSRPEAFGGQETCDGRFGDLIVRNGRAVGLSQSDAKPTHIALTQISEPHVHLDKCHTIQRLQGAGGDLAQAIEFQHEDKLHWTADDIRTRAARGLADMISVGCRVIRSHVDWDFEARDPVPLAWEVIGELAAELGPTVTLQRAALADISALTEPARTESLARRIARDGGVLGAFVYDQPDRRAGIEAAFRAADRHGLALDFHVDEGLSPGLDGLEMIADIALETRFEGPVLCGHACSLANLPPDAVARLADKLFRAGISVASLPQTNLYLQGRGAGTPDRRGLTRIHELRAAGVNVVLGADNVGDAFCPIGRHGPLETLRLAVMAAQLDAPFDRHLPMITTGAARALGIPAQSIDGADIDEILIFKAGSIAELIAQAPVPEPLSEIVRFQS